MKELSLSELREGMRIRFATVGRGYAYRIVTREYVGTFYKRGERGIWVTLDGKENPSIFINLFGIWEA